MDYNDFLKTDQWQLLRKAIWEHYDGKCHICNAPGDDVHHWSYSHGLFNPRTVILVCRRCHLVWRGEDPEHLDDDHPWKPTGFHIAHLARCLGWDKLVEDNRRAKPKPL